MSFSFTAFLYIFFVVSVTNVKSFWRCYILSFLRTLNFRYFRSFFTIYLVEYVFFCGSDGYFFDDNGKVSSIVLKLAWKLLLTSFLDIKKSKWKEKSAFFKIFFSNLTAKSILKITFEEQKNHFFLTAFVLKKWFFP